MKAELRDHPKFLKLRRLLGEPIPHVLGYLLCLWQRGYQTGNPVVGDALVVEESAGYPGEIGKFAASAKAAGFLDVDAAGNFVIHDLYDHAPGYARKRMHARGTAPEGRKWSSVEPVRRRPNSVRTDATGDQLSPDGQLSDGLSSTSTTKARGKRREKKEEKTEDLAAAAAGSLEQPAGEAVVGEPKPPRPRDELFDALVAVTGVDAKVNGGHVGRVKKLLASADPPYTPAEVLRFADPGFLARELPWAMGRKPTLGEVEKHVGRVRNPSTGTAGRPPPGRGGYQTRTDEILAEIDV